MTIEVTLIGEQGRRSVGITPTGFHTRHIKTPRESVPSLFGDVSIKREPVETPETATDDSLKALLAEVDAILTPKPRANTSKEIVGYHYTGHPTRPETNWDSPAVKGWLAYKQQQSDALMERKRERAKEQE